MPQLLEARVEECYRQAEAFFKRSFSRPRVSLQLRGQKAGVAHLQENHPCEALEEARDLDADKWFIAHMATAAAAGACGDMAAAAAARDRLLAVAPSFETDAIGLIELWRFEPRLRDAVVNGLRAAGLELPESDGA